MYIDDSGVHGVAFASFDPLHEAALVLQELRQTAVYKTSSLNVFLDDLFAGENIPVKFSPGTEEQLINYLLDALYFLNGRLRVEKADPVVLQMQRRLLEALLNFEHMRAVVAHHYPVIYAPEDENAVENPWMRLLQLLSASLETE